MPVYKNTTSSPRTFHGVTINPQEVKEVPGLVNCDGIVQYPDNYLSEVNKPKKINQSRVVEKKTTVRNSTTRNRSRKSTNRK